MHFRPLLEVEVAETTFDSVNAYMASKFDLCGFKPSSKFLQAEANSFLMFAIEGHFELLKG